MAVIRSGEDHGPLWYSVQDVAHPERWSDLKRITRAGQEAGAFSSCRFKDLIVLAFESNERLSMRLSHDGGRSFFDPGPPAVSDHKNDVRRLTLAASEGTVYLTTLCTDMQDAPSLFGWSRDSSPLQVLESTDGREWRLLGQRHLPAGVQPTGVKGLQSVALQDRLLVLTAERYVGVQATTFPLAGTRTGTRSARPRTRR